MAMITISYRRDDSDAITGRIFDRLVAYYGKGSVFRDIDNIPLGSDFRHHINQVLGESNIVLVVVGPRWLGPTAGRPRVIDEADPVRIEVETALQRGLPIIPILIGRTRMPRVTQLPDSMKDFAFRNGVVVDTGQDFDNHIARLIRATDRILKKAAKAQETPAENLRRVYCEPGKPQSEAADEIAPAPAAIGQDPASIKSLAASADMTALDARAEEPPLSGEHVITEDADQPIVEENESVELDKSATTERTMDRFSEPEYSAEPDQVLALRDIANPSTPPRRGVRVAIRLKPVILGAGIVVFLLSLISLVSYELLPANQEVATLRGQIAALRDQLSRIAAALDVSEAKVKEQQGQIVELGKRLNLALVNKVEELAAHRRLLDLGLQVKKIGTQRIDNGLLVEGDITTSLNVARPLPRLRIALTDSNGNELDSKIIDPPKDELAPGEVSHFKTSFVPLKNGYAKVGVTFSP